VSFTEVEGQAMADQLKLSNEVLLPQLPSPVDVALTPKIGVQLRDHG